MLEAPEQQRTSGRVQRPSAAALSAMEVDMDEGGAEEAGDGAGGENEGKKKGVQGMHATRSSRMHARHTRAPPIHFQCSCVPLPCLPAQQLSPELSFLSLLLLLTKEPRRRAARW